MNATKETNTVQVLLARAGYADLPALRKAARELDGATLEQRITIQLADEIRAAASAEASLATALEALTAKTAEQVAQLKAGNRVDMMWIAQAAERADEANARLMEAAGKVATLVWMRDGMAA